MYSILKAALADHYSIESLQRCYRAATDFPERESLTREERLLSFMMRASAWTPLLRLWRRRYLGETFGYPAGGGSGRGRQYDEHLLHLMTNRVYDMPEVCVVQDEKVRFNVLVPAFSIEGISAGFFGVFQVGLLLKELGASVRLVMFDNFLWDEAKFRESLAHFPGMESLFDQLEIEYIGERKAPLRVSPCDTAVATVWYSAYFAEKIQQATGGDTPFLYLIQDYETRFFAGSSLSALAERTYQMKYCALLSSETLFQEMTRTSAWPKVADRPAIYFNNACSASLPSRDTFMEIKKAQAKKRLVIYSRPDVNRNMFELTALSVIGAYKAGYLPHEEWEFFGIGMGDAEIQIDKAAGVSLKQLPRMSLGKYIETVAGFDLCVSLMASAHPSMLPFDLAGSGALVVTNEFESKNQAYFSNFSANIVAAEAHLPSLIEAIGAAAARTDDLDARYRGAQFQYPTRWDHTWGAAHEDFLRLNFPHHFPAFSSGMGRKNVAPLT